MKQDWKETLVHIKYTSSETLIAFIYAELMNSRIGIKNPNLGVIENTLSISMAEDKKSLTVQFNHKGSPNTETSELIDLVKSSNVNISITEMFTSKANDKDKLLFKNKGDRGPDLPFYITIYHYDGKVLDDEEFEDEFGHYDRSEYYTDTSLVFEYGIDDIYYGDKEIKNLLAPMISYSETKELYPKVLEYLFEELKEMEGTSSDL